MRAWEAWADRSLATPEGPLPIAKGDVVVVLVVPSWSEAFAAMQGLLPKPDKRERE
jgi:hypothetical protein